MIKVYYIYAWKYHNETPHFVPLIYANKIKEKENQKKYTM
jgi:hypothetical protein